ncbi:hypothetical protein [Chryseobacterium bernardetii]|uniref:hypothetical protein n=1 Tax=Chryseobacterium bernardetii TaxID=1241978 RepID=UPI0030192A87
MNEIISTVSDVCGILGFLISIYATSQVIKLKQKNSGDNNIQSNVTGNIGRDYIGRDKK